MDDQNGQGAKRKYQATVEDDDDEEIARQTRQKCGPPNQGAKQPSAKSSSKTSKNKQAAADFFKRSQSSVTSDFEPKPSKVKTGKSKPSKVETKQNYLMFLGSEIKISMLPAMYRRGSDYMNIVEKASKQWHLDECGQKCSAQALVLAHHKTDDKNFFLSGSVMAVAMENEILKAQMRMVLEMLGQMATRVDTIDHLAEKTKALTIGCTTVDELRQQVADTPSASSRVPLEEVFSKISLEALDLD